MQQDGGMIVVHHGKVFSKRFKISISNLRFFHWRDSLLILRCEPLKFFQKCGGDWVLVSLAPILPTSENAEGSNESFALYLHKVVLRFTQKCFSCRNGTKRLGYSGAFALYPSLLVPSCYDSHFVTTYSMPKFQVLDNMKVDIKPWIFPS